MEMNKQNPSGEQGMDSTRGGQAARPEGDVQAGPAQRADEGPLRSDEGRTAGTARQMMTNTLSTTEHVASGLVAGVATVASDLVHGVGDIGSEVVLVVKDTANTAIAGVGSVGETALHTLTGLLVGLVGGVREIGSAAVRGRPDAMENNIAEARPAKEEQLKQPEVAIH
jgi:hypothetical protein